MDGWVRQLGLGKLSIAINVGERVAVVVMEGEPVAEVKMR
jgi:hypothetical protein